jgi:hypothetical protein
MWLKQQARDVDKLEQAIESKRKRTVTISFILSFFALRAFNAYVCLSLHRRKKRGKEKNFSHHALLLSNFAFEPLAL